MPAFAKSAGGMLTDKQIDVIVRGIRERWSKPDVLRGENPPPYSSSEPGDASRGSEVYARLLFFVPWCRAAEADQGKLNRGWILSCLVERSRASNDRDRRTSGIGRSGLAGQRSRETNVRSRCLRCGGMARFSAHEIPRSALSDVRKDQRENFDDPPDGLSRRKLLMKMGILFNGIVAAVLAVPIFVTFCLPWRADVSKAFESWLPLGELNQFPAGQTRFATYRNPVVNPWDGKTADIACWVRNVDGQNFQVFAINCAHLGCPVRWFPQSSLFMCPCHGGAYYQDGSRASGPPERGLFEYHYKIEERKAVHQCGRDADARQKTTASHVTLRDTTMRLIGQIGEWLDARLQVGHTYPRDRRSIRFRAIPPAGFTFSAAPPSLCLFFKSLPAFCWL